MRVMNFLENKLNSLQFFVMQAYLEHYWHSILRELILKNCKIKVVILGFAVLAGYLQLNIVWTIIPLVLMLKLNRKKIERIKYPNDIEDISSLAPSFEQSEWLNTLIRDLWAKLLRPSIKRLSLDVGFGIKIIDCHGDVPFRIRGVKVHRSHKNKILADLSLYTTPNFRVEFSFLNERMKGEIINIMCNDVLSVEIILTDDGNLREVNLFFEKKPEIDIELSGVGSVFDVLFLGGKFKDGISDMVKGFCLPKKLTLYNNEDEDVENEGKVKIE